MLISSKPTRLGTIGPTARKTDTQPSSGRGRVGLELLNAYNVLRAGILQYKPRHSIH